MSRFFRPTLRVIFLALLCSLLLVACETTTPTDDSFLQANRLYEQEHYDEAILAYQGLVQSGIHDASLYYNLGNACYKTNDIGCAILNYRRAQRLQPRDPDISANLTLARSQTVDRLTLEPKIFPPFVYTILSDWNTANESAVVALAAWITLCLTISIMIITRRSQTWMRTLFLIVTLFFLLATASLGIHMVQVFGPPQGVIQAENVEVHSGPGTSYITEFQLHAGAEIQIIEPRNGWVRIQSPGNLQGWVPSGSLETLQQFSLDS